MLRIKFYLLGPKISALSSIIKILVFWHRKMAKLFKPLNPYKMKTINIFMIGNDFSRRFRRCRIRIWNNLKFTILKGRKISNPENLENPGGKVQITQKIETRQKIGGVHFWEGGGLYGVQVFVPQIIFNSIILLYSIQFSIKCLFGTRKFTWHLIVISTLK